MPLQHAINSGGKDICLGLLLLRIDRVRQFGPTVPVLR